MNLDDFIITCFCLIDEMLPSVTAGQRLRERGPMPKLSDSEVIQWNLLACTWEKAKTKDSFHEIMTLYLMYLSTFSIIER